MDLYIPRKWELCSLYARVFLCLLVWELLTNMSYQLQFCHKQADHLKGSCVCADEHQPLER